MALLFPLTKRLGGLVLSPFLHRSNLNEMAMAQQQARHAHSKAQPFSRREDQYTACLIDAAGTLVGFCAESYFAVTVI
jgi:hypothetical protein